ncbi:ribosome maturation factor RimP [bacterium]|nr:ribosome maturation factor RimP [bacterium]
MERIREIAGQVCDDLGVELFDLEIAGLGRRPILRVTIDCPTGITVEDCAKVSREMSALLDVYDPIDKAYQLEVSSPGVDRPIRHADDARRMVGKTVKVRVKRPRDGRRVFKGTLAGVAGNEMVVQVDGKDVPIDFNEVEKANLVFEF